MQPALVVAPSACCKDRQLRSDKRLQPGERSTESKVPSQEPGAMSSRGLSCRLLRMQVVKGVERTSSDDVPAKAVSTRDSDLQKAPQIHMQPSRFPLMKTCTPIIPVVVWSCDRVSHGGNAPVSSDSFVPLCRAGREPRERNIMNPGYLQMLNQMIKRHNKVWQGPEILVWPSAWSVHDE